mgnify:CR=1 FL=1
MSFCSHEDGHFQCSFNAYNERGNFFKRPLSGDCRDLASLNTVQLVLSSLCGECNCEYAVCAARGALCAVLGAMRCALCAACAVLWRRGLRTST